MFVPYACFPEAIECNQESRERERGRTRQASLERERGGGGGGSNSLSYPIGVRAFRTFGARCASRPPPPRGGRSPNYEAYHAGFIKEGGLKLSFDYTCRIVTTHSPRNWTVESTRKESRRRSEASASRRGWRPPSFLEVYRHPDCAHAPSYLRGVND